MPDTKIEDISILIAEDEEKLLHSMVEYLQLFFTNVYATADGKSAYALYKNRHPDIIIADIHMPHMDGLTLIKEIRKKDHDTRIIITTAHSDKEKLLQAIELNLVKYLIKPVQSDILKTLLLKLVEEIRTTRTFVPLKEGYRWDRKKKILFDKKQEIVLKPRERKVLDLLIGKAGQTVSAIDIYNHLYEDQPERDFSSDAVTSLIKRLRQKLPKETLKSSYGVGYIFFTK
ncbi:response regulator transcription factor [Sulfurovum riftiae]|uniref:Transcriptional regulator n=1 Tax=Sulfurovum riftiae TaxID=1630136 RepID=A0A151CII2_9BACT|nr:response regulator transcription factor [Sulfurovum riftiae]KYJ87345.1 transcriptional regulator [Sulfurovum riftiae]